MKSACTKFVCKHCKKVVAGPKWKKYNHSILRKYCSKKCWHLHNTGTIVCALCKKIQRRPKSNIKRGSDHFCCKAHRYKFRVLSTNSRGPDSQGYIWVRINGGPRQMEHRVVMAKHLKRDLRKEEKVHHRDGNKIDNKFRNLELWSIGHPSGQRVVDKIRWAKKFLKLYGYQVKKETK